MARATVIATICSMVLIQRSLAQITLVTALSKFLDDGRRQTQTEPEDRDMLLGEYDFIVVGAGTAGCTLANRLSEVPEWNVLLVEAGSHESFAMDIPLLVNHAQFSEANWKYTTVPFDRACQAFDNKECKWPRGKVLGGSSVLNYMVYTRGNRRDFDRWESLGNPGWGWKDVLPYFKKIENFKVPEYADPEYHGTGGNLDVGYTPFRTNVAEAWVQAGQEAGHRLVDYNGKTQTGVSFLQLSISDGARHSANRAYLLPVSGRPNLHIVKESMVTRLIIDKNDVAVGIEMLRRGIKYTIGAKKEVIVSGGSINSPQLLMVSGIGPSENLKEFNIPVIKDLKVGYNLMDHIAAGGLTFTLDRQNTSLSTSYLLSNPGVIFQWMYQRTGPMSIPGGVEALTFIDSKNPQAVDGWPDIELLFIGGSVNNDPLLKKAFGFNESIFQQVYSELGDQQCYMIFPMLMRSKSQGRIKLKSADPLEHPLIYPNYFAYEKDFEDMVAAIRAAIKIAEQPAMKRLGTKLYDTPIPACVHLGFGTDAYWRCHAMQITFTVYHYSGTCKMGPSSDPEAVVDSRLRVHGIKNLRVADASIMPEITSGHTNSPVYMIAEKAADMIKEDWGVRVRPDQ